MFNFQTCGVRKRKYVWVLLIAAFLAVGLSGCKSLYRGVQNKSEECQYILDYLNCDYELLSSETRPEKIISRFHELTKLGKTDGFYPLIVIPSTTLTDILYFHMEDIDVENAADGIAAYRKSVIDSANEINAKEFLSARYFKLDDILGEFVQAKPRNALSLQMLTFNSSGEVIIAKIPTENPWELAVWVPMGGFNECPTPAEQVAVFHYWYDKYGAVPAVVNYDTWQMTLAKPSFTADEAMELAEEQFAFCYDIVLQGTETIRGLASILKNSSVWFFWWD